MITMDFLFNLINNCEVKEKKFTHTKKDILKFLKIIGVDSRFISYAPSKIYINNLRFSKFSRKRENTFKKHFPEIKIIRSTLFMKICSKSSRILANKINPNDIILLPSEKNSLNNIMAIILEPYSRKYGVKFVYDKESQHDLIANPIISDDEVKSIFSSIFKGEGIDFNRINSNSIYPFINVPKEWIDSFLQLDNQEKIKNKKNNDEFEELSLLFMDLLEEIVPQYKGNVLKAADFIENKLKVKQ